MEILGTYPILNSQASSIDDDGIQTIAYTFTVPTSVATLYIPDKNSEYYGPPNTVSIDQTTGFVNLSGANVSKYLVTSVDIAVLPGGLSRIIVKTAGSQNVLSAPKITIIPNYPLLFGLSSITQTTGNQWRGAGSERNGYGIIMRFITRNDPIEEGQIFRDYGNKIMPSEFRGVLLPVPTRGPFVHTGSLAGIAETPGGGFPASGSSFNSAYLGFICKNINVERIGGVTLFQLTYSESGRYSVLVCTTPTDCSETVVYDYIN